MYAQNVSHPIIHHPSSVTQDPPPPAATPSPPPPTKGALKRLPSLPTNITSLKEKSKLTRNITRMVSGLSLTDLHQQICDAGAMETIVSMVRGDVHSQQLAADVLLDVAAHQCRVHHLAKRGAVQVCGVCVCGVVCGVWCVVC